jgi:hypothetical protein
MGMAGKMGRARARVENKFSVMARYPFLYLQDLPKEGNYPQKSGRKI